MLLDVLMERKAEYKYNIDLNISKQKKDQEGEVLWPGHEVKKELQKHHKMWN